MIIVEASVNTSEFARGNRYEVDPSELLIAGMINNGWLVVVGEVAPEPKPEPKPKSKPKAKAKTDEPKAEEAEEAPKPEVTSDESE